MLMLIDKGYYDYDYKFIEKPIIAEETVMSEEKLQKTMSRFGFGRKTKDVKEMDMDEFQTYAMNEIENK